MADSSQEESSRRGRETTRAALLSVVSNTFLTAVRLMVGISSGAMSVVAEGIHSANDLVASLVAYFSLRKASKPADVRHAFGHGKFESLSGTIEAILIMGVALGIAYTAFRVLLSGEHGGIDHGPALIVMAVSMVANLLVSSYLFRVARRHDSLALQADGLHLRVDVWTSGAVFVGLGVIYVVELTGRDALWIDPALALLVAVLVMTQGTHIARDGINQLLDRSLPPEELGRVAALIQEHAGQFVEYHQLRSRRAGHQRHIDLHLVVCDHLTVAQGHEIADHLEADLGDIFPGSQVLIHVEPCGRGACETHGDSPCELGDEGKA